MTDINGQILGVTGTATKTGKTKYEVAFSDGTAYTTFDGAMAQRAQAFTGQPVSIRVNVKQNGKYTNYYFEDVAPQGQLPAQAVPVPAGTPVMAAPQVGAVTFGPPSVAAHYPTTGSPIAVPAIPVAPAPQRDGGMSPEREAKIVKQSSLATAANLVGAIFNGAGPEAMDEAEGHVIRIAKSLYGFVMNAQAPQVVPPQPTTPQEMAAVVNQEIPGAAVQVGVQGIAPQPSVVIPWN